MYKCTRLVYFLYGPYYSINIELHYVIVKFTQKIKKYSRTLFWLTWICTMYIIKLLERKILK